MKQLLLTKVIQIGGALLLCALVFATVFFAEGYHYDSTKRDLVQRSVIVFENLGDVSDLILLLDGKPASFSFGQELRVESGVHEIILQRPGSNPWKKRVNVQNNSVVRFPEIKLLPSRQIGTQLQSIKNWSVSSISDSELILVNPMLHIEKAYQLTSDAPFKISDLSDRSSESLRTERSTARFTTRQGPISWMSRIGESFHFLILSFNNELFFCDEDGENCHSLGRIDSSLLAVSYDKTVFMTAMDGKLVSFDFGRDSLLKKLFSADVF